MNRGLQARALEGERGAWDQLVSEHGRVVYLSLLSRGVRAERARELTQETWTRLWRKARAGGLGALQLPGLAIRQAAFLAGTDLRRARTGERGDLPGTVPPQEDEVDARRRVQAVLRALAGCDAIDRSLFQAVYSDGMPHAEVALLLGLSVQRTRQRLCELRGRLRDLPEFSDGDYP